MYRTGDVEIVPTSENLDPEDSDGYSPYDARAEDGERVTCPYVHLPHSCDDWIIGGPEQVEAMIADLTAALAEMRRAKS